MTRTIIRKKPWYKKPFRLMSMGVFLYAGFVGVQIFLHWTDPNWCSPWLRPDVCEATQVQDRIQKGIFSNVNTDETDTIETISTYEEDPTD